MLERVIRIIAEYADVSPEEINENTNIRADLGRLAEQDAQALAQQEQRISDLASRVDGFEAGLSDRVTGIVQDSQADLAERLEELASQGREQERKTAVRLDEFMEKISDRFGADKTTVEENLADLKELRGIIDNSIEILTDELESELEKKIADMENKMEVCAYGGTELREYESLREELTKLKNERS